MSSLIEKLKQIKEGWGNYLLPPEQLKTKIAETAQIRLDVCRDCQYNSTKGKINLMSFCRNCGCNLEAKTRCLHCSCPLSHWTAVLDETKHTEVKEIINGATNS